MASISCTTLRGGVKHCTVIKTLVQIGKKKDKKITHLKKIGDELNVRWLVGGMEDTLFFTSSVYVS